MPHLSRLFCELFSHVCTLTLSLPSLYHSPYILSFTPVPSALHSPPPLPYLSPSSLATFCTICAISLLATLPSHTAIVFISPLHLGCYYHITSHTSQYTFPHTTMHEHPHLNYIYLFLASSNNSITPQTPCTFLPQLVFPPSHTHFIHTYHEISTHHPTPLPMPLSHLSPCTPLLATPLSCHSLGRTPRFRESNRKGKFAVRIRVLAMEYLKSVGECQWLCENGWILKDTEKER